MKVYSPNKSYTGVTASVPFCGGVGETEDPYLLDWFREHGYIVKEPEKTIEEESEEKSEEKSEEETVKEPPKKKEMPKKAGD